MRLLACWLKLHKTRVVAVYHYNERGRTGDMFASTAATQICEHCGKLTVTKLEWSGFLTVEELNSGARPLGPPKLRVVKSDKKPY